MKPKVLVVIVPNLSWYFVKQTSKDTNEEKHMDGQRDVSHVDVFVAKLIAWTLTQESTWRQEDRTDSITSFYMKHTHTHNWHLFSEKAYYNEVLLLCPEYKILEEPRRHYHTFIPSLAWVPLWKISGFVKWLSGERTEMCIHCAHNFHRPLLALQAAFDCIRSRLFPGELSIMSGCLLPFPQRYRLSSSLRSVPSWDCILETLKLSNCTANVNTKPDRIPW